MNKIIYEVLAIGIALFIIPFIICESPEIELIEKESEENAQNNISLE